MMHGGESPARTQAQRNIGVTTGFNNIPESPSLRVPREMRRNRCVVNVNGPPRIA